MTNKCGTLSLDSPIEKLELNLDIEHKLRGSGIGTLEDLTTKCACDILEIHGIGWLSMELIIDRLQNVELSLNPICRINRK